ncbi:unnamed protein product, partial [marine sediment metagenome]
MTNIIETTKLLRRKIAVKTIDSSIRNVKIKSRISYLSLGKSFMYIYYRIRYINVVNKNEAKCLFADLICLLNPDQLEEAQLGEPLPRNS